MKNTILENMSRAEREAVLQRIKAARGKPPAARPSGIPPRTAPRPDWPLSFAQQGLWFVAQQWPTAHNLPFGLALRGALDLAALQAALDRFVARHEALRTCFEVVDRIPPTGAGDGQPVQRVVEHCAFPLVHHDLGDADREAALDAWRRAEATAAFELSTAPVIRGRLLRFSDHDHVLLLTTHHIVFDGWSLGILATELGELYRAYVGGLSPAIDPLPALPVQYPDYALWQRERLVGEVQDRHRAFWREQLATAPALVSLPTDRPRPATQDRRCQTLAVELDAALASSLKALSQRHGMTLYMTLLAAWGAVVARLAGQEEVVIGTPVAGRTLAEVEPLVGNFVNVLAQRLDLRDRPTVAQLLAQVRDSVLQAQSHQDLPFEQVVEAINPPRTLAHSPIFQLTFAWQNTSDETLVLDGLELQGIGARADDRLAQYDLELDLHERDGGIAGTLSFAAALFDAATVQRYLGYLEAMLRGMVRDDAQAVDAIDLISAAERRQVVTAWNDTARRYPELPAHAQVAAQAARTPDAVALEHDGQRLTYRALDEAASRLAHQLRAWGVGPEDRVVLCLRRGVELVTAMLAVAKAGGAYVPLDPAYPTERLAQLVRDSAPRVVLTQAALAASFDGAWALDGDDRPWDAQPASALAPGGANDLAYVIYTSGSTGQPNGVMVEHRQLANLIGWHCERFPLQAGERTTSTAGVAFDACTWEVWPALCMGATLVLPPSAVAGDPSMLLAWWDEQDVQCSFLVTALAEAALARGQGHRRGLRSLLTGGDRLSKPPAAGLPFELVNNYGLTESTVVATSGALRPDDTVAHIGRPIANTQIYLLDRHGQPVGVGVPGEIYIGGAQVARGYWNRPELTRARFVPDPFTPGARMYKTGDLARWRADGTIEYLGRNDHQVKIRGLRIELGEIEAQLARQPGVTEAAVIVRADVPGEARLVAYVVGEAPRGAVDPQRLRQALMQALPAYMVPAAYVVLDALPLTPNGKLDQRALPAPDDTSFGQRTYEPPQGEVEQALAQILCELLGVERVGRHDDFFKIGGHSLLAVQLSSRLRKRLGLELDVTTLFNHPVLADLAAAIAAEPRRAAPAFEVVARPARIPLSFAQQRLWFIAQMGTLQSTAYHVVGALRLGGALDAAALQAALDRIVQRHEALRTSFEVVEGQPVQRVAPTGRFPLHHHDLSAEHAAGTVSLDAWYRGEVSAPFDLATGPLLRGRLLQLAAQDHVLLLTIHHIVFDAWSLGVLTGELATLYQAYAVQRLSTAIDPLPPLAIQYPDHAVWQRAWLTGEIQDRELAFWRQQLANTPALISLPTDRPRPPVQEYQGQNEVFELDPALSAAVVALSRRHGSTLYMTVLAAWAAVVARLAGQDDVVIGSPVANRTRAEVEPLIGFFVNTLALRIDLAERPSVAQLLARVRAVVLEAQHHQELPFEQVVEAVKPQRTLAHTPIFQLMFAWQNTAQRGFELAGLRLEEQVIDQGTASFDLTLDLGELNDRIVGTANFATALFDPATVRRYLGYLEAMLRGMVRDDAQAVDAIDFAGNAARGEVLAAWNDTARDYPQDRCIHELIEAQADRAPDAVAVVCQGDRLTYRALDAQANQLAHHLRALGVSPDARIAICMPNGVPRVVAVLATWKAGGAYVPLDPAYPAERLALLLRDSKPAVLLTTASLLEQLPTAALRRVTVVDVTDDAAAWHHQPSTRPARAELAPHHLAYVIYTSGSTGQPKGVMIEHRGVCNLATAQLHAFPVEPRSRILSCASFSFDAHVFELVMALCNGASLYVPPAGTVAAGAALTGLLAAHRITHATLTPSVLAALDGAASLADVETLVVAGEVCPPALVERWAPGRRFINAYGPTETTVWATWHECRVPAGARISIGRPIANAQVYVLDEARRPVGVGEPGELYAAGAGLARGYLNLPALTAERFVEISGTRLYKTGDLARWQADGTLDYLGRNDHQVKLRGLRIELGEIEAQLARQAGIREAAVIVREDTPGAPRLVAYVVGDAVNPETLRQALARALPDYMVPAAYVVLDALPLTANGKLDRRALPDPDRSAFGKRTYEAPHGEIEHALAEIWSQLLSVERVGRHDNFFELGGHSLLVTRMVAAARRRGLIVDLRQAFDVPTLKDLAAIAQSDLGSAVARTTLVPVRASGTRRPLFCLHEGFGSVLAYERLARFIDADVPIYSIEAIALHEDRPIYRTLPELARSYLAQIATVQPVGPYRLAGWSGGGLIAYEIANQLLARGETVELVGMFDTYNLTPEDVGDDQLAEAKHFLIRILEYTHPQLPPVVLRNLLAFDELEAMVAECHRHGWLKPDVTASYMRRWFQVSNDLARASVAYVAAPLAIDVQLYSAQEPERLDPSNGWARVLGSRLHITRVSGSHMEMMQRPEPLAQIAGAMNQVLLGAGGAAPHLSASAAPTTVDSLSS